MNEHKPVPTRRPKAYKNEAFLDSADARPLRILSEYLEPCHISAGRRFVTRLSSSVRHDREDGRWPVIYKEARELARL